MSRDRAASDSATVHGSPTRPDQRPSALRRLAAAMLPSAQPKRSSFSRIKDPFERFQESTRDAWSADDDELTVRAATAAVSLGSLSSQQQHPGAATAAAGSGTAGALLRRRSSLGVVPATDAAPPNLDDKERRTRAVDAALASTDAGSTGGDESSRGAEQQRQLDAAARRSTTSLSGDEMLSQPAPSAAATASPADSSVVATVTAATSADVRHTSPKHTATVAATASAKPPPTALHSPLPAPTATPPSASGTSDVEPVSPTRQTAAEKARFARLMAVLNLGPTGANGITGSSASSSNTVDLGELRQASWSGVPSRVRPLVWKLLSGYLPAVVERRAATLDRKRREYFGFVEQYYDTRYEPEHQDTFRQIHIDIPRMSPSLPFLQDPAVQEIFERILYIWAIRHPASGYVQGINDLVTPFFVAFISEYTDTVVDGDSPLLPSLCVLLSTDQQRALEADCFWCLSKLLSGVQENYVFAQPGIQKKVLMLKELVARADGGILCKHVAHVGIEFLQFSFRWMNNLLLRELPLRCSLQLWDTYHAETDGFATFHLYVCAAFLLTFSGQLLKQTEFQGLMTLLQNFPTEQWAESEMRELVAKAYQLKCTFPVESLMPQTPLQPQQPKPAPVAV